MRQLNALPILFLLLAGCAKNIVHPGAVDALDSRAYDTLLILQAALDEAKAQVVNGKLPASASKAINLAGESYNAARTVHATYHNTKAPSAAADLTKALVSANASLASIQALTRGEK